VLDDGQKVIVDVAMPRPGFYFPKITERRADYYLTLRNEPWYQPRPLARKQAQ
jgi:hypothetical protein